MTKTALFLGLFLMTLSINGFTKPKYSTNHNRNHENFARVQVVNETRKNLTCFVAIDGRKIKFILRPFARSKWYKATDTRFDYTHFRTWCDYAELGQ